MASYKQHNNNKGKGYIYHTATGYECASFVKFYDQKNTELKFFAKHILSLKGKPYTEFGFYADVNFDTEYLYGIVSKKLSDYGFDEVSEIDEYDKHSLKFTRYKTPNAKKHLESRLCAGDDGILILFFVLKDFFTSDCINFVREQELEVEDVLYQSVWQNLGHEMCKSVGGVEYAQKHCREIAHKILHGF